MYNLLVDGGCDESGDEEEEDDATNDTVAEFSGYKQMMLVLQSQAVETGKSFLSEILVRIFHGKKMGVHSTLSFDSAKSLLGRGEPVVIDDYLNDEIGCTLLSRASKAIWAKAKITIRNLSIVPNANLLFCTNEEIKDLKVEGRSKDEIFSKFSVISLGEEPMRSINSKGQKFKEILEMSQKIRKHLPSFYGVMLQVCGSYITAEEFRQFEEITKHERLGNILKNVKNLHSVLVNFCEAENVQKPKSLQNKLNTICLTIKSELSHKFKSPGSVAEFLMLNNFKIALTHHNSREGVAFDFHPITRFPWFSDTFSLVKDGCKVFSKMRTRQLHPDKAETSAAFLSFDFLNETAVEKLKEYVIQSQNSDGADSDVSMGGSADETMDPVDSIIKHFESECLEYERIRLERFHMAEEHVQSLFNIRPDLSDQQDKSKWKCKCGFVAKSKGGLTNHSKMSKKCKAR